MINNKWKITQGIILFFLIASVIIRVGVIDKLPDDLDEQSVQEVYVKVTKLNRRSILGIPLGIRATATYQNETIILRGIPYSDESRFSGIGKYLDTRAYYYEGKYYYSMQSIQTPGRNLQLEFLLVQFGLFFLAFYRFLYVIFPPKTT